MAEMIKGKHLPMDMLPPAPGTCPVCAAKHEPHLFHDLRSLFYQYSFYNEHGRWPTWEDAMLHCTPEVRQAGYAVLLKHGLVKDGKTYYLYGGDRNTDDGLKNKICRGVLRPDGKSIRSRMGTMLVEFVGTGKRHVIIGNQLRKILSDAEKEQQQAAKQAP